MNVETYICEGELTDNSPLYIPDFNHHEHRDMSYPQDSSRTTLNQLKAQGSTILKNIDITANKKVGDNQQPIIRHLLVVSLGE